MKPLYMIAAAGCVALAAGSANAENVDFTGTLTSACTLAVPTPGLLALSTDGTVLGSEEVGGLAATATVLSIGSSTVTVGAPSVVASPAGYDDTNEAVEVKYVGQGGLSLVDQSYSSGQTQFATGTIPLSNLVLNAKVTNTDSFDAGDYTVRTVLTCS